MEEEEEEKKYYGQGLRSDLIGSVDKYFADGAEGLRQLSSDPVQGAQTVLGTGLTTSLLGGLKPGVIGSAVEKQMFNKGTASLANPAYRKLLGQGILRQGAQVAGIPVTAAVIAGDTVLAKSAEAQAEMDEVDAYQKSLEQKGIERAQDQALTMRKYNIIEEQRAAQENRTPYGYDPDFPEDGANINLTNFRDYLAQVPADYRGPDELDFSSIDLSGQSEFPYYKDQSLNTGIDFSKFEQGEDPATQPNLSAVQTEGQTGQPNLLSSTNPNFKPEETTQSNQNTDTNQVPSVITSYLGKLIEDGKSDDYRTDVAARYLNEYQGRANEEINAKNNTSLNVRSPKVGSMQTLEEARTGVRPDFNQAIPDNPTNELTMADYRAILREQGIGGSAQIALAKQMMNEAAQGRDKDQLASMKMMQDIINSRKPKDPRAPTNSEMMMDVVGEMVSIQDKLDRGIPLSDAERMTYQTGNAFLSYQQNDPFAQPYFVDPSKQEQQGLEKPLPTINDESGKQLIEKMKQRYPNASEEEIIDALRQDKKLSA